MLNVPAAKATRDEKPVVAEQALTPRPASPAFGPRKLKVSKTIDKNSLWARGGAGTEAWSAKAMEDAGRSQNLLGACLRLIL